MRQHKRFAPVFSVLLTSILIASLSSISFAAVGVTLTFMPHQGTLHAPVSCKFVKITKQNNSASPNLFQACIEDDSSSAYINQYLNSALFLDATFQCSQTSSTGNSAPIPVGHVDFKNAKVISIQHIVQNHDHVVLVTCSYLTITETWVKGGITSIDDWTSTH
jgi:type VI protein secretion system component Hcp